MRASRAYIASLGTTGVLIASALMLLVVVSAIVAFRGWPGDSLLDRLESLTVDEDRPALALSGPEQVAVDAAPAAAAVADAPAPGSAAAGGTAGTGAAGGLGPGAGGGGEGSPGVVTPVPPRPTTDIPGGGRGGGAAPGLPGDVQDVTDNVGGTTRGVSGAVGDTVGQVSPDLGRTVTDTGDALSDLVEGLGVGPGR